MNNPIENRSRRSLLQNTARLAGVATLAGIYPPALMAQNTKPILIGCTHDLTGTLSMDGTWNDVAVKAAAKWVNSNGGIGGRPIELHTEDTETNTQTALRKFRSLVLDRGVDFVVGATHSGHNIASAPVAKELKTPYFASGTALETTTTKGNRWIFRGVNNIRQQMKAMALVALKELKPRYYFIGADYAWGRSLVKETKTYVSEQGGQIIGESFIPLGTADFAPYLNNIDPRSFDTLVVGMTGGDAVRFLRQAYSMGLLNDITVVGNIAVTSGSSVPDLGPGAKGSWYTTMYPRRSVDVPDALKAFDEAYRSAIGVDGEGTEKSTGRVANLPYSFVAWQAIFQIKQAIEQSGWGSRSDHPKFIQAMEGLTGKGSIGYPQGDFSFRPEDHQIVHRQYIETVRNDRLEVVTYIEPDQLGYPPEVDYRTEAL
ncbi:ABC transporter substrate-binding protein [Castellaniella sp. GW247-6E4]|uniref:ABC transporter substrate-binding protein n=1 Tax=Castellaniella sp. GW247-6E4 TaxID=3140380 RepID=UPI0033147F7A